MLWQILRATTWSFETSSNNDSLPGDYKQPDDVTRLKPIAIADGTFDAFVVEDQVLFGVLATRGSSIVYDQWSFVAGRSYFAISIFRPEVKISRPKLSFRHFSSLNVSRWVRARRSNSVSAELIGKSQSHCGLSLGWDDRWAAQNRDEVSEPGQRTRHVWGVHGNLDTSTKKALPVTNIFSPLTKRRSFVHLSLKKKK